MKRHRFHVVSLPHTQTTLAFTSCAYTEKVRKFCIMMMDEGHEVFLYAGERNEAPCTEHVAIFSEAERLRCFDGHYTEASFLAQHWTPFNERVIAAIGQRAEQRDFICLTAGIAHKPVADAFPNHVAVEFGIGYGGSFAKFRVFESYAWMHATYAAHSDRNLHGLDGNWFDAVVPGYLEPDRFPFKRRKDNYCLFVGRLIERKGAHVALEACRRAGYRLVVAGIGTPPGIDCEFVGEVDWKKRGELMSRARCLLAPTIYIEPFGNVVPEAQACGTPTITTDWGAFTETNIEGVTGYRCRTLSEFVRAIEQADKLDPYRIRMLAVSRFSLEAVAPQYTRYFDRLSTLWDKGWYA